MNQLELVQSAIKDCTACDLRGDFAPVPVYTNNPRPKLVVIGPGPSQHELIKGVPFLGKVGNYVRKLVADTGIAPKDTAWMNVACCGAAPSLAQMTACRTNCRDQLEALGSPVCLVLGGTAVGGLLPFTTTLKAIRGRWWQTPSGHWAVATYHPSSTLHAHAPNQEAVIKRDMLRVSEVALLGDLVRPQMEEHCLMCTRWAAHFIQKVGFCSAHVPRPKVRKGPVMGQLSLLD